MKDLQTIQHHPLSENIVDILCQKTQNLNKDFYRILVAYYFSKVAATQRCQIKTHDRGLIPVNTYAINLAVSGFGKGHSTNIMEDEIIHLFRDRFIEETLPEVAEINLAKLATKRAAKKSIDPDVEIDAVKAEYERLGPLAFSFDSGTTPAIKQMRHKLLMADAGSMNLEIDEIGSNLLGNVDALTTFLELFDVGKIKQKLTKNTAENSRSEEIIGRTPTNMLLFGTPNKLLDGGKTEDLFYSMLETGYARRCLFCYVKSVDRIADLTPEQVYDMATNQKTDEDVVQIAEHFFELADQAHFGQTLQMSKDVSLLSIEYRLLCEKKAEELPEHEEIRKSEISHRYFKAVKVAGAYAFVDASPVITETHLYAAIKLVEESGEAFQKILKRDRNYVKLANYLAEVDREVTHVDLVEDVPCYKGSSAQKQELMTLAIAHGYKNNIIIRRSFNDGIEFFSGESLKTTNLNEVLLSFSDHYSENYKPVRIPFDKMHKLTQKDNYHWASHIFTGNHRSNDNTVPGFNLIVLDVDEGTPLNTAKLLLKDYTYLIHTTKRHTEKENRYRVILPISHELKMHAEEFREFMQNVFEWLPFEVDTQTAQRARKWATYNGDYFYNEGQLLDALQFIPKTSKNDERKRTVADLATLTNIERWFITNTGSGNRSNQLIKYALMLVDTGLDFESVKNNVLALNNKIQDKLDESEILATIMVTVAKAIQKRDTK